MMNPQNVNFTILYFFRLNRWWRWWINWEWQIHKQLLQWWWEWIRWCSQLNLEQGGLKVKWIPTLPNNSKPVMDKFSRPNHRQETLLNEMRLKPSSMNCKYRLFLFIEEEGKQSKLLMNEMLQSIKSLTSFLFSTFYIKVVKLEMLNYEKLSCFINLVLKEIIIF